MTIRRSFATLLFAAILSALSSQLATADNLSVPNTFQSGQPARATDVNANFSAVESSVNDNDARISANENWILQYSAPIVLEGGDNVIGVLAGINDDSQFIKLLSPQGFIFSLRLDDGSPFAFAGSLFFASANCSGAPYSDTPAGFVSPAYDLAGVAGLYYSPKESFATKDFVVGSVTGPGGCFSDSGTMLSAWPMMPNDPSITGIPSRNFVLPIRIDQPK